MVETDWKMVWTGRMVVLCDSCCGFWLENDGDR